MMMRKKYMNFIRSIYKYEEENRIKNRYFRKK